jgi:asparagine synthase (glutamine-hydrolysing)
VLNGEIFGLHSENDIQNTLAKTDTELLNELLKDRGTQILPDLNGLFAFCLFDGNKLLLARDRFGIKPLYYASHRGGLVFASEMKAILSLPGFPRELDEDVISSFSVVGHNVFSGKTPFRAIRSVLPGHTIEAGPTGALRELPFAQIPEVPEPGHGECPDPEELQDLIENLLTASVRRAALHDPNPKALFFSGGLDSSLLLDIARKEIPVTAFVLSDRDDADDLVEARRIAAALDIPLEERFINESDLARELVHYAWHFEHPIAGGSFDLFGGVAFHILARHVGSEFRVAFCGEGADEMFLGYHRLHMEPDLFIGIVKERIRSQGTPALVEWIEKHNLARS